MIHVEGLTKYYGDHAAIRDLKFDIQKGEVIGFLGLNGAGKTTTLKVLGCVLVPTAGHVEIDGYDVLRDPHEVRKRIGFLPDTPPVYEEMTVGRYLRFVAELRGVSAAHAEGRVKEVEERTALTEVDQEPISSLSHGYRQRVGVAQALVHNPKLIILDEPTGGLDPVQIVEMRSLIRKLKGEHTVLVSSHILSEISQTCDRLLVINNGEIVAQGTEADLAARAGGGTVELEVKGPRIAVLQAVSQTPGVLHVNVTRADGDVIALRVDSDGDVRAALVRSVVAAKFDLLRLEGRLESIFVKLTSGKEAA